MNKLEQIKKSLKLSDADKKVLLAYADAFTEASLKPALETAGNNKKLT